jgi:hypothetical protein
MKMYVCYGTWTAGAGLHRHPCGEAHKAVIAAGYAPEVVRSYGFGPLPAAINGLTSGRREVKELTGNFWVPVLVTDDGTAIQGSERIIAWARANPAPAKAAGSRRAAGSQASRAPGAGAA